MGGGGGWVCRSRSSLYVYASEVSHILCTCLWDLVELGCMHV